MILLTHLTFKHQCFVIYLDNLVKSNEDNIEEKVDAILTRMEDMYMNKEGSEFVINNYGYNLCKFLSSFLLNDQASQ